MREIVPSCPSVCPAPHGAGGLNFSVAELKLFYDVLPRTGQVD